MKIYLSVLLLFILSCKNGKKKTVENVRKVDTTKNTTKFELKENVIEEPTQKEQTSNFNVVIEKVNGDLNKDGIADLVTVKQDTISDKRPYQLQIYLSQPDKKLKLALTSDSAIVVRYPNGKYNAINNALFTGIKIYKGTLTINHELIRGSFSHQFRYQHNKFELIGYRSVGVSGGTIEKTDFNLLMGEQVITKTEIGSDKIISVERRKQHIKYLRNLAFFEPYQFMY